MRRITKMIDTTKENRSLAPLLFVALILFSVLLSFRSISSLDYGIHIATGRWILQHNQVPETDPFSWSFSDHTYLAYHWGFQVIMAKLEAVMGLIGPILFRCLVITLTISMLLSNLILKKIPPVLGTLCLFLSLVMLDSRMLIRPELFSYLLLAMITLIIEYQRKNGPNPRSLLFILPLIFLVWINTHIYLFGFFVAGCYLLEGIMYRKLDKSLNLAILLSLLVLWLNPYGIQAITEPFHLLTRLDQSNPFKQIISELRSPLAYLFDIRNGIVLDRSLLSWLIFTFLMVPSLWGLAKNREWTGGVILCVFWLLSVSAIRNIGLLAVAGLPHIASGLRFFLQDYPKLSRILEHRHVQRISLAILLVASLRVVTGAWYLSNRSPVRLNVGYESGKIPVKAASFVEQHNLKGYGFNTLNAGGALLLNAGSHKIFIDGRNEVTNEDFLLEYLRVSQPEHFQRFADDSKIEYCVVTHQDSIKLSRMLISSPLWKLVYYDESAIVVVKRNGLNESIPEAPLGYDSPTRLRGDMLNSIVIRAGRLDSFKRWMISSEKLNTPEFDIGSFLIRAGFPKKAENHLLQAVSKSPHLWEIWSNLGALYIRLRMWGAAALAYKTVVMLNPTNHDALLRSEEAQLRADIVDFENFRIVSLPAQPDISSETSYAR